MIEGFGDDRRERRGDESLGACLVVRGPWGPWRRAPLVERSEHRGSWSCGGPFEAGADLFSSSLSALLITLILC